MLLIIYLVTIFIIGIFIGMIFESIIENVQIEEKPQHTETAEICPDKQQDLFEPF